MRNINTFLFFQSILLVIFFFENQICVALPKKDVRQGGQIYHVSKKGNDTNDGTILKPLKTIMAAAKIAMPCDEITVHEGIYRERVDPPRGGESDKKRITYQAAPCENVVITGSELVKGWKKVQNDTWMLTLPNSFFESTNPFDEQIYGSWYRGKGKPNHTGSFYLNGKRIRESFSAEDIFKPIVNQRYWCAEADGNGDQVLMNESKEKCLLAFNPKCSLCFEDVQIKI